MPSSSPTLHTDGRFFRDDLDRIRILRGVNLSGRAKDPPFLPLHDPDLLVPLRRWGFNTVRLLLTWEGVEPEPGRYDEAYLDAIAELATRAGQQGMFVLVDMHQDIFARAFGGDGAPAWVLGGSVKNPPPNRRWFLRYLTSAAVRRAQHEFWIDRNGHRTRFIAALGRVMERMRSIDAVIGYDPWNEPMSGLRHVLSGRFERQILPEFYAECARLRDQIDPQRLIFAEPTPLAALGAPTGLRLPPAAAGAPGFVYAPHVYDSTAITLGHYTRRGSTFPRTLRRHLDVSARLRAPLFVGEFGVLNWVRGGLRMLEDECRQYDRHFVSWTVWHYNPSDRDWNDENASFVEPDGSARPWAAPLFRPYPTALAGAPRHWESRPDRPWVLEYTATSEAPTEIVVPVAWSERAEVEITGAEHRWNEDRLLIEATAGQHVRVQLDRR